MGIAVRRAVRNAGLMIAGLLLLAMVCCKSKSVQRAAGASKPPAAETPLPPPTLGDVTAKVKSIYKGALIVDSQRKPVFLVGDFNADRSEDVIVAVKPDRNRLDDLNSDLAGWILEDPHLIWVPDPNKIVQALPPKPKPVRVQAGERLLLIIHGFQEKGWRNPMARQSYLLVNVAGYGLRKQTMQQSGADLPQGPLPAGMEYLLRYRGEVLRETIAGKPGILYWTGGHYVWMSRSQHIRKYPSPGHKAAAYRSNGKSLARQRRLRG
jgi:hypothetical protein